MGVGMIKIKFTLMLALLFWLSPLLGDSQEHARTLREQGEILDLEVIIEKAKQEVDGRLIELEFEREGGHYIYELEMLGNQGRVWELKFDARTGELIEKEEDD